MPDPTLAPPSPTPRLSARGADVVGVFVLLAATLAIFGNLWFTTEGFPVVSNGTGDVVNQFLAWRQFGFDEMARGHLPFWNPHFFCGAPYLGGFQSALLYPPNWLYMILPLGSAVNLDVALHVFLAGLWTFCWARRRGFHPAAAVAGGLVFTFGGAHFLHVWAGHLPNLCTMAWAPLLFLAIDEITTADSRRQIWRGAWIGAGAQAMQVLAGHPQYVYYTAIIAGLYACLGLIRAPRRAAALLSLLAIIAGGAALSAAQLLPGLAATAESARSGLDFDLAKTFAFAPENLVTTVMPDFFGTVEKPDPSGQFSRFPYWGRWLPWEDSLFIGVAAFSLAAYGAIAAGRRARRFSLIMIGVAIVLALGFYTPLYYLLYSCLPGFGSFRGVSKFIFLAALFLSMLTAAGLDRLLRAKSISSRPAAILLLAAILLGILGAAVVRSAHSGPSGLWAAAIRAIDFSSSQHQAKPYLNPDPEFVLDFPVNSGLQAARSIVWCGGTCLLLAGFWWLASRRRLAVYGIMLVGAVELGMFASANRGSFQLARFEGYCAFLRHELRTLPPDARIVSSDQGATMMAGGNSIFGDDPMMVRRYAEFSNWAKRLAPRGEFSPAWRMVRLQYQLTGEADRHAIPFPWQPLAHAQVVPHYIVVPNSQQMLVLMEGESFDPRELVLLEAPIEYVTEGFASATPAASQPAPADAGLVKISEISTEELDIRVTTPRPAILLITDTYASGWQARPVDPNPPQQHYEVVPADRALRAIPLAAGTHHLRVQYVPPGWRIGRWISVAALVVFAAWGAFAFLGRRKQKQTEIARS